jgi:hexulose-6-phosphate isomerase
VIAPRAEIGFMQGRLSALVNGRIQAFPAEHWREEFALAEQLGFSLMEWTIDHDEFDANPFMTPSGRAEIRRLQNGHGVSVQSVTADSFMQTPFFKNDSGDATAWLDELRRLVDAAAELGLHYVVVPLVDNGRVESASQAACLREGLGRLVETLGAGGPKIIFESDFEPAELAAFIADYPASRFGINYDIGNSASLGHDPRAEITAYAARIDNVHVKDRLLGGTTVPLGQGAADLKLAFDLLRDAGYGGNFILQTARATDGNHAGALCTYRDLVRAYLDMAG